MTVCLPSCWPSGFTVLVSYLRDSAFGPSLSIELDFVSFILHSLARLVDNRRLTNNEFGLEVDMLVMMVDALDLLQQQANACRPDFLRGLPH